MPAPRPAPTALASSAFRALATASRGPATTTATVAGRSATPATPARPARRPATAPPPMEPATPVRPRPATASRGPATPTPTAATWNLQRQLDLRELRDQRRRLRDRLRHRVHLRLGRLRDRDLPQRRELHRHPGQICNASHTCANCTDDTGCQASYTDGRICVNSVCVIGSCHDNNGCSNGQVCVGNACVNCANDSQCSTGQICLASGACTTGNCHVAADCNDTTKVCAGNNCSSCTTTADCTGAYGNNHVCNAGSCMAGNCVTTTDCAATGPSAARRRRSPAAPARSTATARPRTAPATSASATSASPAPATAAPPAAGPGLRPVARTPAAAAAAAPAGHDLPERRQVRLDLHLPGQRLHRRQLPHGGQLQQHGPGLQQLHLRHLQRRPPTARTPTARTTSARAAPASRATATQPPTAAATSSASATPASPARPDPATRSAWRHHYGAMHICLNGQCVAGNCHDTSSDCTARPDLRHLGGAHLRKLRHRHAGDNACKADTHLRQRRHLPRAAPASQGDCHDTSADCTGGQDLRRRDGPYLRHLQRRQHR